MSASRFSLLTLIATLTLWAPAARATTILRESFADLVAKSDVIVVGTVLAQESQLGADRAIYTSSTLGDLQIVRGVYAPAQLELRVLGGEIEGNRLSVVGAPTFAINDRLVLFIRGNGSAPVPLVGWTQGVFRVRPDRTVEDHAGNRFGTLDQFVKAIQGQAAAPRPALSIPSSAPAATFATCGERADAVKWLSNTQPLLIDTTSFPAGEPADQTIRSAISKWNGVVGSLFRFSAVPDPDDTHDIANAKNELYLDSSLDPSAITMTLIRSTCKPGVEVRLNEVDMAFNGNVEWSTEPYSYDHATGAPYNLEGAALHEVGHALGLLHEDGAQATMNTFYPYGGPLGSEKVWEPFGEDRAGDGRLYPSNVVEVDLAASPLRATGQGTSVLVSSPDTALAGSTVQVQVTLANLGPSAQTFDVGFYLSADPDIAVSDLLLRRRTFTRPAGATSISSVTLRIPRNVAPGSYFLGFIVDPDDDLVESLEENNAQVLPTGITIF